MTNRSKLHESIVSILFEILKGEDMNPSHFIHEIKTKGYNVIGILCVLLLHLWDSTQKPENSAHPILLQSFKSMNTVHYLWVTIWPNVVDFYELSKMLTIFPTAWKKNLFLLSTFSQLQRKWFIWSLVLKIALFLAFLQKWILILFILISINELCEESIVPNSAFQQSLKFIDRL